MKKLNKINVNELLYNSDDEMWYNLLEEDKLKFNKSGYYKIKCKDDSYIESIEYIGKKLMNMVWYCRQPMEKNGEFVACHECKSCIHVDNALL